MHEPLPAEPFFPLPLYMTGSDKKGDDKNKPGEDKGPVRTQMVGESPGDDLGYDPSIIPTEKIPDDDEDEQD